MQNAPDFKMELFNSFSQPVIFMQEGKVSYANHAAAACGIDASQEQAEIVEQADDGVQLRLGDILAPAQSYDYQGGTLYIADENWAGAHISPDALLNVAQAMRVPLTDVFSVSDSLFAALEEMEDPNISRSMARLNKSFYQLLRLMCDLTEMPAAMDGQLPVRLEKVELRAFVQQLFVMAESLCQTCGHMLAPLFLYRLRRAIFSPDLRQRAAENHQHNKSNNDRDNRAGNAQSPLHRSGSHLQRRKTNGHQHHAQRMIQCQKRYQDSCISVSARDAFKQPALNAEHFVEPGKTGKTSADQGRKKQTLWNRDSGTKRGSFAEPHHLHFKA